MNMCRVTDMTGTNDPSFTMEGFRYLRASLPEIQSPVALEEEISYRVDNLMGLIESGEWESDRSGNVIPASMSDEDKEIIASCARFSIIDCIPEVVSIYDETRFNWSCAGIIISGYMKINCDYPGEYNLHIATSTTSE